MCDDHSKYYHTSSCSGHGNCLNNSCVCSIGWTDIADFAVQSGFDCDINLNALFYLGIVGGVISGIVAIVYIKYIITNYLVRDFDSNELMFIVCLLIFNCATVMLTVFRPCTFRHDAVACYRSQSIGINPMNTIFFAILMFCLNLGYNSYLSKCLEFLSKFNHVISPQAQLNILNTIAIGLFYLFILFVSFYDIYNVYLQVNQD